LSAAVRAFIRLSRLKFLAGGFVGGGFGTAIAAYERGSVGWGTFALAQMTITALHLMTHYANDYFDRHADVRATRTPYSGGSGTLVDGSLPAVVALRAALVAAALGAAGIAALAFLAQRPVAALIGCAIAALAWAYSAPPLRLLARGLGELDSALVVGILVPLCTFAAQGSSPDARAFTSTLPGAAAMLAMMLAVEYPDLAADTAGGKANLVVRLGALRAQPLGVASVAAAYALLATAKAAGAPPAFVVFDALSLPLGIGLARTFVGRCRADRVFDEALAARGVAFFFVVALYGLLAYGVAPHPQAASATNRRTVAVLAA